MKARTFWIYDCDRTAEYTVNDKPMNMDKRHWDEMEVIEKDPVMAALKSAVDELLRLYPIANCVEQKIMDLTLDKLRTDFPDLFADETKEDPTND